jgi:hypothetical protein
LVPALRPPLMSTVAPVSHSLRVEVVFWLNSWFQIGPSSGWGARWG